MKLKTLFFFALILCCYYSRACICNLYDETELFYKSSNIQKATINKIIFDSSGNRIVSLTNIETIKGNAFNTVFLHFGLSTSSCGIHISEGERWVFFFDELMSEDTLELFMCTPSRVSEYPSDFDLEFLFEHAYFKSSSVPEDVYLEYIRKTRDRIDSMLVDFKVPNWVFIKIEISKTGIIEDVRLEASVIETDSIWLNTKIDPELMPKVKSKLVGEKLPVFRAFNRNLNIVIGGALPRE